MGDVRTATHEFQGQILDTIRKNQEAVTDAEQSRLVTFAGLGHLFFWEDPGGFAATVPSFVREEGA